MKHSRLVEVHTAGEPPAIVDRAILAAQMMEMQQAAQKLGRPSATHDRIALNRAILETWALSPPPNVSLGMLARISQGHGLFPLIPSLQVNMTVEPTTPGE